MKNLKLDKTYFENKTTLELAKDLIGKVFTYESDKGTIKGIINETEAYTEDDESCHAYNGNRTKKNEVMFWESGHLYVYFTYGMYFCANIVTGPKGKGEAVLIRGVIPIEGKAIMIQNRKWENRPEKDLANGPAKFAIAYNMKKEHNGENLLNPNSKIYIEDLGHIPTEIKATTRIGISKATNLEWRFIGIFDRFLYS